MEAYDKPWLDTEEYLPGLSNTGIRSKNCQKQTGVSVTLEKYCFIRYLP